MSFLSQPLQNIFIKPKRMIDTISVQVVTHENAVDTLTVTKQPVQQGASITDHAYKEPTIFSHDIYFAAPGAESLFSSGNGLDQIYQQLLTLQKNRIPFDIITPKRIYNNMLLAGLSQTTDKLTENCLAIHASYQEVILVPVLAGSVPRTKLKNPGSNGATQNGGPKSVLYQASHPASFNPAGGSLP